MDKTDWGKITMAIAVAIVFIMQQYHAMMLSDVKDSVVPRTEYEEHQKTLVHRDVILHDSEELSDRIEALEVILMQQGVKK